MLPPAHPESVKLATILMQTQAFALECALHACQSGLYRLTTQDSPTVTSPALVRRADPRVRSTGSSI